MRRGLGISLLALGAVAIVGGAAIAAAPEAELGHVLGFLLMGIGLLLAVLGGALLAPRPIAAALLGGYLGAFVAAVVTRLLSGFVPDTAAGWIPFLGALLLAGPVLAANEMPLAVAAGALAGGALGYAYGRRTARVGHSPPTNNLP